MGSQSPVRAADLEGEQLRLLNARFVEKVSELEAANGERRKLVGQLLQAHEEERKRLAEALHDDSIQAVVALGMRLELLAGRVSDRALAAELRGLQATASLAAGRLRSLLFELQPAELDRQRLAIALETYLEQAEDEDGLEFEIDDRTSRQPGVATRTLLYRMAQEVLVNVRKHADASRVRVLIDEYEAGFLVAIQDDGTGFSPTDGLRARPGHLGLPSIRGRVETAGGSLRIESLPGGGATVEVRLPELEGVS